MPFTLHMFLTRFHTQCFLTFWRIIIVRSFFLANLPIEIGRLSKLETLDASNNRLTRFTPPCSLENFNAMINLRTVRLSGNSLTEFPLELCSKAMPLDILDLSQNQIEMVPSCVESLQVSFR